MRVNRLSDSPDRVGRYRLELEDGSVLRPFRQNIEDFCLFSGRELSEEELKELRRSVGQASAKMRAVRIVSASSISKSELEKRLIQKGERPEQAKEAVNWMADLDLIDDRKTAEQIVYSCIHKGYGRSRAKQALYEKRIPREFWEEALADYPDQTEKILAFLHSRLNNPTNEKEVRRVIDALLRRGHSYAAIRRSLEQFSVDLEEFPEE